MVAAARTSAPPVRIAGGVDTRNGLISPDNSMEPTPPRAPDSDERTKEWREKREAAKASAIGIQFVVSIALGALGGKWLDGKFGTAPWLLLTGVVFGSIAAFRDLYRIAKRHADADTPPDPDP